MTRDKMVSFREKNLEGVALGGARGGKLDLEGCNLRIPISLPK